MAEGFDELENGALKEEATISENEAVIDGINEVIDVSNENIQQHIHRNIDDAPDSLSLGTDGKLGCVKVYFNANNVKEAEEKIVNALKLRKFMRDQEAIIEVQK